MRIIAPMMILIMMTSTLAGCTGGDPDGGGNDEIDMDILNQLIDDNLQDFINNTTITVENHYHNNTTIVNDNTDNSISNINGTEGASISSMMHMFTVSWIPNIGYDIINHSMTFEDSSLLSNNETTNGSAPQNSAQYWIERLQYDYNNQIVEINPTCWELTFSEANNYYSGRQYWAEYLINNYGYRSAGEAEDIGYDIHRDLEDLVYTNWANQCVIPEDPNTLLFEININLGETFKLLSSPTGISWNLDCVDGFSGPLGVYVGGQSDCILSGSATSSWNWGTTYVTGEYLGGLNNYHNSPIVDEEHTVIEQFAIYYELFPVIVDE